MLTNTHDPPLNANFGDEHGKVTGYNDRQGNGVGGEGYSFTSQDLTIPMSFLLLSVLPK